jgi:hypothetical protein
MSQDFITRVEELGTLHRELTTLVAEGRWRVAAEIAGAIEVDLDELREKLREQHRVEVKVARQEQRQDARLAGDPERLRRWKQRKAG